MRLIIPVALVIALAAPALAQQDVYSPATSNRLDCVTTFRDLDRNADGVLAENEMSPSDPRIPTSVSTSRPIGEEDFVRLCAGGRTLPQGGSPEN